jgi:hypothetical protein
MAKRTLTVKTNFCTFTRTTASDYTHAVVWASPRAKARFDKGGKDNGVAAKWLKDQGHGVTWHGSLAAAQKATGGYCWDGAATLLGIYPCEAI